MHYIIIYRMSLTLPTNNLQMHPLLQNSYYSLALLERTNVLKSSPALTQCWPSL
jgi:hypothetical protein